MQKSNIQANTRLVVDYVKGYTSNQVITALCVSHDFGPAAGCKCQRGELSNNLKGLSCK